MPEIILENITKKFGKFVAVKNLNLHIPDRSFITLLGPSGCGKTTILRMIAGLEDPTSGKITIDGKVVFDSEKGINVSPSKREIGFLFQNYALWPHMTVWKNIAFGLENEKWKKEDIQKRIDELLELLKIEEFDKRYPSELSGGQQQRVAIARTLAPRPKILFMDEPLSNLDAKLRLEMRTELKRLFKNTDSTFVYVTHDQLEAMTLSTKVCLLKLGEIEQYDTALETYSHPKNMFVADFVGSPTINFIEAKLIKTNTKYQVEFAGTKFDFIPSTEIADGISEITLGIRPEYVEISENGLKGTIYSSLPSGMSTTVLINYKDVIITSVLFGVVDYPIDSEVRFDFMGDNMILFDRESGRNIGEGKIKIKEAKQK